MFHCSLGRQLSAVSINFAGEIPSSRRASRAPTESASASAPRTLKTSRSASTVSAVCMLCDGLPACDKPQKIRGHTGQRRRPTSQATVDLARCPDCARTSSARPHMAWTEYVLPIVNLLTFLARVATEPVARRIVSVWEDYAQILVAHNFVTHIRYPILAWQFTFVIYSFFPGPRKSAVFRNGVSILFALYNTASIVWTFFFARDKQYEAVAVGALVWLFSTILVFRVAHRIHNEDPKSENSASTAAKNFLLIASPFSLNLAWESAKLLASVNVVLTTALPDEHGVLLAGSFSALSVGAVLTTFAAFAQVRSPDDFCSVCVQWADFVFCGALLWPLVVTTVTVSDPDTVAPWVTEEAREALLWTLATACFGTGVLTTTAIGRWAAVLLTEGWYNGKRNNEIDDAVGVMV